MLRHITLQRNSSAFAVRCSRNSSIFSKQRLPWKACLQEDYRFKWGFLSEFGTISKNQYNTQVCLSRLSKEKKARVWTYSMMFQCYRNSQVMSLTVGQYREFSCSHRKFDSSTDDNEKSPDQRAKEGKRNNGIIAKLKGMLNTFWIGCKQLLWIDARKAWATKKKLKRHDYDLTILTREELRHMRQTQKDIIKSLPVALLFFVPFIGYFAPVLGYLFPKRLLSPQFWDIEQQKKFAFEDYSKRSQYYLPLVQELGWSSRELKHQDLFQLCIKVIDGNHLDNEEILKQREVFNFEIMMIKKMPRYHLVKLCKTWLLPVKWYMPSRVLREFLSYRIKQIIEDDAAIRRDGVDILSDICIRQACHARGLDKYSFAISVMKQWLEDWLKLTENLSEEDKSFIAHCAAVKTMNFNMIMEEEETETEKQTNV